MNFVTHLIVVALLASIKATMVIAEEPAESADEPPKETAEAKPDKPPGDGNTLYKIQNDASGEFLYVDTETSGSYSADVFTGPLTEIRKSSSRFMTFTLTPVGDAYQIDCPDVNLTLTMVLPLPPRAVSSVALKAEHRDRPDDYGLWYMAVSPSVPTRITNKDSSYFLYAYRLGLNWKRHTVVVSPSKGVTFVGSSLWLIKEATL